MQHPPKAYLLDIHKVIINFEKRQLFEEKQLQHWACWEQGRAFPRSLAQQGKWSTTESSAWGMQENLTSASKQIPSRLKNISMLEGCRSYDTARNSLSQNVLGSQAKPLQLGPPANIKEKK